MERDLGNAGDKGTPAYVSVADFAALLGVSPQTVYKMAGEGALVALRVGRQWRIDAHLSLERLAEGGQTCGRRVR